MIGWLLRRLYRISVLLLLSPLFLLRAILEPLVGRDVLHLRLTQTVPDFPIDEPAWMRYVRKVPKTSIQEIEQAMTEAEADAGVKTVLLELDRAELTIVQAEVLLGAIDRARKAGKKILVWADGLGAPALVVGAASDQLLGVPEGSIEFLGVRARAVFIHDLLTILGVVPDLDRHGDYKTMADTFTHQSLTEPHKEMLTALGGDLFEQVLSPLMLGRGLDRQALTDLFDDAPVGNVTAVEKTLLDGTAYRDELVRRAGVLGGVELKEPEDQPSWTPLARMLSRRTRRLWLKRVWRDPQRIQVVHLEGTIVPGESGRGCLSRAVVKALEAAQADDGVVAVVLRIDSPGGSALASDEIWRGVHRLDQKKPVIASMGTVAASGGYYAAVGARAIFAHAATLTGSIGIVSGKFHLGPALHRWGINMEGVSFGERAGMLDPDRGMTPPEREAHHREMMRFYTTFVSRCAQGRKRSFEEIDAVAQGRVYTGRQAQSLGLVDRIGGVREAIELALEEAKTTSFTVIEHVNPNKQGLEALLPNSARAPDVLTHLSTAATLLKEPALAYCPWIVSGL